MNGFRIISPGIQTTVQDLGRPGLRRYGIPVSGAMDQHSYVMGNLLLGNPEGAASLETAIQGLKLEGLAPMNVAITGADLDPWLNNRPAPMWSAFEIREGDILHFKRRKKGFRAYLAAEGGFDVQEVLGSRSTFVRGGIGAHIRKEEIMQVKPVKQQKSKNALSIPQDFLPDFEPDDPIRVLMGPQADYFTARGMHTFLNSAYRITPQTDRQACRTEGPPVEIARGPGIISDPIPLGSIQVPGDGQPIILFRDAQVTGGYAKIAMVAQVDMDRLGQMVPGEHIRFQRIERPLALDLLSARRRRLDELKQLLR